MTVVIWTERNATGFAPSSRGSAHAAILPPDLPLNTDPGRAYEQAAVECVVRCAGGVSLHAMREAPDADLLHEDGAHIGVEVVRTVDQTYLDAKTRLEATADAIERELLERSLPGHFVVYLDVAEIASVPPRQRRDVAHRLATFLATNSDRVVESAQLEAQGVQCIARVERSEAPNTIVRRGWRSRTLGGTLASICLEKKDERLRHYRKVNGAYFAQYWLAIASLGPGTVEDGGFMMLLNRDFATDFDRVFLLMRGFDGRLASALDVTPNR